MIVTVITAGFWGAVYSTIQGSLALLVPKLIVDLELAGTDMIKHMMSHVSLTQEQFGL